MSLAELKGTPLGTKLGIPTTAVKTVVPIKTFTSSILTRNIKTTTVVPVKYSGSTTAAKELANPLNVAGQVALGAFGFTGIAALGSTVIQQLGLNPFKETIAAPAAPPPKTGLSVKAELIKKYQPALDIATNQKMGSWMFSNSSFMQKTAASLNALTHAVLIKKQTGIDVTQPQVPGGESPYKSMYELELYRGQLLTDYANKLTGAFDVLSKGAYQGASAAGQAENARGLAEWALETPGAGTEGNPSTGTNWGNIAIIGIIAIAGVLLLSAFIKKR